MTELIEIINSFGFWIYFPILILVAIPMLRYILRMGSDDDDDDEDGEKVGSKVIPRRSSAYQFRKSNYDNYDTKIKKVVRGLIDTGKYDPKIITRELKIKSADSEEPILCPNCGVSVMTQWQKCYHCGELL